MNLISNAVKFTQQGNIKVIVKYSKGEVLMPNCGDTSSEEEDFAKRLHQQIKLACRMKKLKEKNKLNARTIKEAKR